jgi:hypothetical protein
LVTQERHVPTQLRGFVATDWLLGLPYGPSDEE